MWSILSNEIGEVKHTKKNMASYGFGNFMMEFITMAFNAYVFFFIMKNSSNEIIKSDKFNSNKKE